MVVLLILTMIVGVVYVSYQRINRQYCEERLRALEAVSSKITLSTYTRFDIQWTSLNYSVNILKALEAESENSLFDELHTIEQSLGFSEGDGMLYLFDEKGYYYGKEGKIGLWGEQKVLQSEEEYSLCVTNLPKQEMHLGDFMLFFYQLAEPRTMDGITITHVALARDIAIFDDDLEIGTYGDLDSSYIIRKNGTRIYHQSSNEIFTNVYNVLKALDECRFEHGATQEKIRQEIQLNKSGAAHMIYQGGDYIMAYQPLNISDWYAVYLVSLDSMNQDTKKFLLQTVLMIGGAGAALLVLCLLLINLNNYRWRLRQQEINEHLRSAVEESRRASRAKSDFLSRMSHDIRTPLNGIIGMTTMAEKNMDRPEKVRDCLQKIISSSDHLMSLINDVLDMSCIENGKLELRCVPFRLDQTLRECSNMIEGSAADRKIAFHCDYSGVVHHTVRGDENHLKQILVNILGNAVKFTPDGGTISFCVTEMNPDSSVPLYRFEVSDTGIGMSEDYLPHIFESFSQEAKGPRTDYKGTGLGMAIVKNLVEQMDGEIKVESRKNKGSRFSVLLPFPVSTAEPTEKAESTEGPLSQKLHGRILLVEDGALNREIAEYLLGEIGMDCVQAENGQQAVEVFSASEPGAFSAILMDIMMPVMDGLTAARTIRAMDRPDAETIPIIAMTANAYREDEEKSIEAGMNAHLTKPLNSKDLICVLKELIS